MAKSSSGAAVKTAKVHRVRVAPQFVNRQPIAISMQSGTIHVGPDKRQLSRGLFTNIPEEAEWISLDGEGFTVSFDKGDGSPFADATFEIPAGGSASSGPIVADTGQYRYTVYDRSGKHKKDPAILVTN